MAFTPSNGGTADRVQNAEIQQIYSVFTTNRTLEDFGRYVTAYSTRAKDPTASRLTYGQFDVRDQSGAIIYSIPKMTFIGYTEPEMVLLDELYNAIVTEVNANPTSLAATRFFQALGLAGTDPTKTADSIYSLRSQSEIRLDTGGGIARGAAAKVEWESGNRRLETLIDVTMVDNRGRPIALNSAKGRTEFFSRVMHEWMHESFGHQSNAYDDNLRPSDNLRELTAADVERLDLAYGGTKEAMHALGSRLQLNSADIDALIDGAIERQVDAYNDARLYKLRYTVAWNINPNHELTYVYTRAELDRLVAAKVITPKDFPDDIDTPEERAQWLSEQTNYELTRRSRWGLSRQDLRNATSVTGTENDLFPTVGEAVDAAMLFLRDFLAENAGAVGQILGSNLGRLLAEDANEATQIGVSTTLGVIGQNLGEVLEGHLRSQTNQPALHEGFENFDQDLRNAGIGAISSFLTAELFDSLGLEGTLADLGQSVFAHELTTLITLVADSASAAQIADALTDISSLGNLVGGFIGTKLASEIVEFDTIAGQVGASIGTAIGAIAGAKIGATYGSWGGPIGAAIGAFIGYIAGGLIGSFFGTTPRSGADVVWREGIQGFAAANAWSKGGAPKEGALSVASHAAEALNALIELSGARVINGWEVRLGEYGTHKKEFVYRGEDGNGKTITAFRSKEANLVLNFGLAYATAQLIPRLAGGDVYSKRAIAATLTLAGLDFAAMPALQEGRAVTYSPRSNAQPRQYDVDSLELAKKFDINVLLGNVATARDYRQYLEDRETIDTMIAADPNSAFAAAWIVTFARALELGLTKRSVTDWIGGWNLFLDRAKGDDVDGQAFTGANLDVAVHEGTSERLLVFRGAEGEVIGVVGDTVDTAGKDRIVGTAGSDTIVVTGDRILNPAGLTINGSPAAAGPHIIRVAAAIDGGAGDDIIVGGDLGNDLSGGEGNDTLVGGELDDWLFGDAGNDRLFASAANHQFTDGDANATAAALNTVSNGDMLDGGEGDDVLYGSLASDWLRGGAGNDLIHGGAGGDIIDGGAGNDSGPGNSARLFGGGGTDQYVFGYGSGIDVVFDEQDTVFTGGFTQDSVNARLQQIQNGTLPRNWAGGGNYEVDGSVRGGEDAVAFGPGIGMQDLILQRSGNDLVIRLTYTDPDTQAQGETGDQLVIKDWFESTRRVEWLRFANGEEIRIGDISSFVVGSSASDIIIGTHEADFLYGGAGNDVMYGLDGDDFGFGGEGNDLVAGDNDNDWVAGGLGDDKVIGGAGNDTAFGDNGNDEVYGGSGSDIVVGGRGNDLVVGGSGDDIFRYERGDGREIVFDDYVNNWEVVWQNDVYLNGYTFDAASNTVSRDGQVFFDGSQWSGQYDFDYLSQTFRRHAGAVNGVLGANSGTDYLEFGVGIDIQDLMLRRTGNDLEIAITQGDSDATPFDAVGDRITIRDWYATGNSIENFIFVATGRHQITGWNITGGTEGADTLTGGTGIDWLTGNGGDDTIIGGGGNDILSGNGGVDLLRGGLGNDVLYGGQADDVLEGGVGGDVLVGGTGMDIASYANAGTVNRNMRAFLGAAHTNTREGAGDTYVGIEGLEGTAGNDQLGGDDDANVLRGAGGNDTLYGGAGDDIYEIDVNHGQDVIIDRPFVTEEIVNSSGAINAALFTTSWVNTAIEGDDDIGYFYIYELVVTRATTGEEVYRSGEIAYPYYLDAPPSAAEWPSTGWIHGVATGVGSQVVREVFGSESGGDDTIELGADIGLSDLTFQRSNGNADLTIAYGSGHQVTINGQNDANFTIESLQLRDGLTADLTRLVLVGETASSEGDFVAGDAGANTLEGLAGDDVISGAAGDDTLRGGEGDDVLEGGTGADTLDGGNDSMTAGLAPSTTDQTEAYGDSIRYVGSDAAVTIDLTALTASGGHAANDVIVAVNGVSTIENVVGSQTFGDTLSGDARANRLIGLGGDDVIDGREGNDVLVGGLGADQLYGGDGEDNLAGEDGGDTMFGGAGNDLLAGGLGGDTLRGDAGEDTLSGGDGVDYLYGGDDDDLIGGDSGNDWLYGESGNDQLVGGDGDDTLYGGIGDDEIVGDAGNDTLHGEAGNDTYSFDLASGSDVIVDASGANRIALAGGITREQVWLTRSGDHLIVGVIGGSSVITLQNYYAATNPTRVREIAVNGQSLFLASAEPLIAAMTSASAAVPSAMPQNVLDMVPGYWHAGGMAVPTVVDQRIDNAMGVPMSGSVGAIDHDDNIVSYRLRSAPSRGTLTLNEATGEWQYTPENNPRGEVWFQIEVIDADGNSALQTVTMALPLDPADLGLVTLVQVASPPAPLTQPTLDSGSWVVHIQATLTDEDRSEVIDLRVTGVPEGISFDTGTSLGNGVWSFGAGPWPTRIIGPATWSQDLALSVTATAREISTGHTVTTEPVELNIEINARPTDIVVDGALELDENTAAGTALASLSAVDADPADTVTYSLLDDAGGRFALSSDGQLSTAGTGLNYEGATSHTIRVQVVDSGGLTYVRDIAIAVRNVNETPTVTNPTLNTNEDAVLTGSVNASDPDGNIVSYALASEPSRGSVTLNSTTGAWTYTPGSNLHGADTFEVLVTDAGGLSAVQIVNVNVHSVNDAPDDITLTGAPSGIAENDRPITGTVASPVVLGTLAASDMDAQDGGGDFASHVFSVTDSRFEIVNGNVLRLRAGAVIDFEASPSVSVDVTVRDRNGAGGGLTFTRQFTFTVMDQDDYFYGTAGGDTITGTAGRNLIYGQGGSDTLTGANANDVLDGGDGGDQLLGAGGADELGGGLGEDVLEGGAGGDTLNGGDGTDALHGQDGNDTLNGDAGLDSLHGGAGEDQLDGGADNDRLEGGDGNDRLVGGTGEDILIGDAGADRFLGGAGMDTVSYETATAAITVNLTTTTGSSGDAAGDIFEDAIETIVGSSYADTITGSAASETIDGGAGNDTLHGDAGNDTLQGGAGDDTLYGGAGDDMLDGGSGNDILIGDDDSDTYLMNVDSGADEIRNFDPNGTDIDVVGYQFINRNQLWFERSDNGLGNDLIVTVVGTSTRTTIVDWYTTASEEERANYKIDFFLATGHVSETIDAEALVSLMSGYTRPATQAEYDALHANATFENPWRNGWKINAAPSVPAITALTINEDGALTLTLNITDDYTPASGIGVTVEAVRVDDHDVEDLRFVNAPTISAPNASGDRTLTVTTLPNVSGQVAIRVRAVDGGGVPTERVFVLTVNAVADAPVLAVVQAAAPTSPLTRPTLDSGFWALDIQAALADQDGSETLEVRIANVPTGIGFNAGTNLGGGVWSFTPAQLLGLRIEGAATWSQDLALSVTAISREISTDQTTTSAAVPLNIVINARPTDLTPAALSFNEHIAANTVLTTFARTDADAGDTATYTLVNNAGGRFAIDSNGTLRAGSTGLDYEAGTSHSITVRVTDSGGLSYDETFTISVLDANEAPTGIALTATQVYENDPAGTIIGTLSRSDADGGDTATYTLVTNPGNQFRIEGNTLRTNAVLNHESGASHTVRVRVTDAGGLTYERDFTLSILNRNEAPTDIALSANQVYENDPDGTVIGTLSRSDVDTGDTATYTLVTNPGNQFRIEGTTLRTNGVLDYEAGASRMIRVRVTDAGGLTYERDLAIGVLNRNETPTDITHGTLTINENTGAGVTIGQLSAVDQDSGETFTFTRLPSDGLPGYDGGEYFNITAGGALQTTNHVLNYEARSTRQVRIQVTDSAGNYYIETLTINIGDAPETPWFASPSVSVSTNEDTAVSGTAVAQDPDGNISSYSLHAGPGRGSVSVNAGGGWTYTPSGNTNGADSFQIRVTDATGLTAVQTVSVNINPINDAPSISTSSFAVAEQDLTQGPGQVLQLYHSAQYPYSGGAAQLSGSDVEGSALAFQVVDQYYIRRSDGAWIQESAFGVNANNQLTLHSSLDYESVSQHQVLVRAWDGGGVGAGAYTDRWITIGMQNVEELPTITGVTGTAPVGTYNAWTYAGTIGGWDPDGGPVTYEVVSSYTYRFYEEYAPGWYDPGHEFWQPGGSVSIDASGNLYVQYYYDNWQWQYMGGNYHTLQYDSRFHVNVRVRDSAGNISQTISIATSIFGGPAQVGPAGPPAGFAPPVVLDLDGDGIELVSLDASSVSFRVQPDTEPSRTGWVGADDALLALDRDGDGVVTNVSEISFINDLPGATSDLEGLAAFDSDHDGYFDKDDARFGEFHVWRDTNQDGVSQAEELGSLAEHGIEAIGLERTLTGDTTEAAMDNVITAVSEYLRSDGTSGEVGDVSLAFELFPEAQSADVPVLNGDPLDIGEIDRSASDPVTPPAAIAEAAIDSHERLDPMPQGTVSDSPTPKPSPRSDEDSSPRDPQRSLSPRLADIADAWEEETPRAQAARSALHASLDSVARRRLLMIDAMASFSAGDSAMLELQPQRHVDARTLELLTAVAGVRNVA